LHEPQLVAHPVVVFGDEARLDVEGLRPVEAFREAGNQDGALRGGRGIDHLESAAWRAKPDRR
jgi:hypothetical protein